MISDRIFVSSESDVGFFAEQWKARHGDQNGFGVDAPKVDEEHSLEITKILIKKMTSPKKYNNKGKIGPKIGFKNRQNSVKSRIYWIVGRL